MIEWLKRRRIILSGTEVFGFFEAKIRDAADAVKAMGHESDACQRAVVVLAEDATSCTASLDTLPSGRFVGDANVACVGIDGVEAHQGGDLKERQEEYCRMKRELVSGDAETVTKDIVKRSDVLHQAHQRACEEHADYLTKMATLHAEERAAPQHYMKLGRLEARKCKTEAALALLGSLTARSDESVTHVRSVLDAIFEATRTPADHVHELRVVLMNGHEFVVGRFASKGGIRIAILAAILGKLAEKVHALLPSNYDILFVSRTDGESAPLRNQGGLTTALQFTQQKAPILAKELKKTVGVTKIYSRVETYVRARMDGLINVVGGLWPKSYPSAGEVSHGSVPVVFPDDVPIKLHTAILRVNIDDEYVAVRLDVRPRAWMRHTSREVPMSDEEALIVRAHALADIVQHEYAEDLHPTFDYDDEDLPTAKERWPHLPEVYIRAMATLLKYKRIANGTAEIIWNIVAYAYACQEHERRGWRFSTEGSWYKGACCAVCVPHTTKNTIQTKIKAVAGNPASSTDRTMVRALLSLNDTESIAVKTVLLGAADKQHTELMKAVVDSVEWLDALWNAGLHREAANFEILNNLMTAFQDTGLTRRVREAYLDAGERSIRAWLGAELYVPGIKSRHRFALRGQCESFLCTIESVRRAKEHLSHTTLHENVMIERQVGSQDSQERSFARIPNHTNHRGSSQLVASACERADAVERLGGQVRAHSRNYDVDSRTQCRVTQWNDGGGIRLHARRWIHGGTADTLNISQHERPSFMQFQHRKRGARQAARGSDMTVRMFHKKYCSNT